MSLDTTEPLTGRAGVEAEYGYTPLPDRERDDDASNETCSSDFEGLRDAAADVAERRAERPDIVERVRGDGQGNRLDDKFTLRPERAAADVRAAPARGAPCPGRRFARP
jgi:hypothetical protein